MSTILVVDLGTAFARATWIARDQNGEIAARGLPVEVPSLIAWDGEERGWVIGERARRRMLYDPESVVSSPLLLLGRNAHDRSGIFASYVDGAGRGGEFRVVFEDRGIPPEVLVAEILAHLKRESELHARKSIHDAIYVVPSWMHDAAVRALADASRLANLEPKAFVSTTTALAAALVAGQAFSDSAPEAPTETLAKTLASLELGGEDEGDEDDEVDERVEPSLARTAQNADVSEATDAELSQAESDSQGDLQGRSEEAVISTNDENPGGDSDAPEAGGIEAPLSNTQHWISFSVGQGGAEIGVIALESAAAKAEVLSLVATRTGSGQSIDERASTWLRGLAFGTSAEGRTGEARYEDPVARARIQLAAQKIKEQWQLFEKGREKEKLLVHLPFLRVDESGEQGIAESVERAKWSAFSEATVAFLGLALKRALADAGITGKDVRGYIHHGPLSRWAWRQVAHAGGMSIHLEDRPATPATMLESAGGTWLGAATDRARAVKPRLGRDLFLRHENGHRLVVLPARTEIPTQCRWRVEVPFSGKWSLVEGFAAETQRGEHREEIWATLGEIVAEECLTDSAPALQIEINSERRIEVGGLVGNPTARISWAERGRIRLDRAVFRRLRFEARVSQIKKIRHERLLAYRDYFEQSARRLERAIAERIEKFEDLIRPRLSEFVGILRGAAQAQNSDEEWMAQTRQRWLDFLAVLSKGQRDAMDPIDLELPACPAMPEESDVPQVDPYELAPASAEVAQ
jgi:hypothetical protein